MNKIIFIIIISLIEMIILYLIIYYEKTRKFYIEYYEIGKGIIRKKIRAKSITEINRMYNNIIVIKEE